MRRRLCASASGARCALRWFLVRRCVECIVSQLRAQRAVAAGYRIVTASNALVGCGAVPSKHRGHRIPVLRQYRVGLGCREGKFASAVRVAAQLHVRRSDPLSVVHRRGESASPASAPSSCSRHGSAGLHGRSLLPFFGRPHGPGLHGAQPNPRADAVPQRVARHRPTCNSPACAAPG